MQRWSIQLLGRVAVWSLDGEEVARLPRKACGLIALLATHDGRAVTREAMASTLWPEADRAARMQSLRTELATVRRILGDDFPLIVHRETCSLDTARIQVESVGPKDLARFAPEMTEAWFENYRAGATQPEREGSPKLEFSKLANWLSRENPGQALELLRATPELACALDPADLEAICGRLAASCLPSDPSYGWFRFFAGFSEMSLGRFQEGLAGFEVASQTAIQSGDTKLFADTLLWQTANLILRGKPEAATKRVMRAIEYIESRDQRSVARLRHAQGLAHYHAGRYDEGSQELERALEAPLYQGSIERATLLSHAALFSATYNSISTAEAMIEEATALAGPQPSWHLHGCFMLVRALILFDSGQRDSAMSELARMASYAEATHCIDLSIYADETMARHHAEAKDVALAARHLRRGLNRRRQGQMGLTPWDHRRLQPVLSVLEQ